MVKEYFNSADIHEAGRLLKDMKKPLYHYYLVKCLVKSAMDRSDREKEMAAQLLSQLCDVVLEPGQVGTFCLDRLCNFCGYYSRCINACSIQVL